MVGTVKLGIKNLSMLIQTIHTRFWLNFDRDKCPFGMCIFVSTSNKICKKNKFLNVCLISVFRPSTIQRRSTEIFERKF